MVQTDTGPFRPVNKQDLKMLDAVIATCVFIAAVAGYVFSSVEKFASREGLFLGGMFIVFALIASLTVKIRQAPIVQVWGVILLLGFSAFILFGTASDAVSRSDWNDRRCLRIQEAMLRPTSKTREGLADVFTAMQCRPQGNEPKPEYVYKRGDRPDLARLQAEEERRDRALLDEVHVDKVEVPQAPPVAAKPPADSLKQRLRSASGLDRKGLPAPSATPARTGER